MKKNRPSTCIHLFTFDCDGKHYDLYGCTNRSLGPDSYDFYNLYNLYMGGSDDCINLGHPFYEQPTITELLHFIRGKNGG